MKKIIMLSIIFSIVILIIVFKNNILSYLENKFLVYTTLEKNEYTRNYNFNYVKNTDNFHPQNKQDLLDIYYTTVNSGMEEFTFYCPKEYSSCQKDISELIKNKKIITIVSDFVHPYNIAKQSTATVYEFGKITIENERLYDDRMKYILDFHIDKIIQENIKDSMTDREKIKAIHDYIINNTKYDKERADKKIINYPHSDTAFGALEEGYAICSGYADSMMLFLEKFGIQNYKIESENHIWNYVYIDNHWYHLDLTWDDPIAKDGKDHLIYDYFLITDEELEKLDKTYHTYDKTIYAP